MPNLFGLSLRFFIYNYQTSLWPVGNMIVVSIWSGQYSVNSRLIIKPTPETFTSNGKLGHDNSFYSGSLFSYIQRPGIRNSNISTSALFCYTSLLWLTLECSMSWKSTSLTERTWSPSWSPALWASESGTTCNNKHNKIRNAGINLN